jgi:hypothetical protein
MSADTVEGSVTSAAAGPLEPGHEDELTRHVAAAKEAWRRRARAMTWEEKIAAIVRMRERQTAIRRARDKRGGQSQD